jgi:hypothetical protein
MHTDRGDGQKTDQQYAEKEQNVQPFRPLDSLYQAVILLDGY